MNRDNEEPAKGKMSFNRMQKDKKEHKGAGEFKDGGKPQKGGRDSKEAGEGRNGDGGLFKSRQNRPDKNKSPQGRDRRKDNFSGRPFHSSNKRGSEQLTEEGQESNFIQERDRTNQTERRGFDSSKWNKKREETLDDIRFDVERVEKDIEFEIKQIQATRLGI